MSEEIMEAKDEASADTGDKKAIINDDAPERSIVFEEALEAVLFAAGHPVSYATLSRVFNMTPSKVRDKVFEYALRYNAKSELQRGVILLTYSDMSALHEGILPSRDKRCSRYQKKRFIIYRSYGNSCCCCL